MVTVPTTQRAYALRLRAMNKGDQSWRDALWSTHSAVNNGARAFGEWILTLRGGLDHKLAAANTARRPLLALSWLSVESAPKQGNPYASYTIAGGEDCVVAALRQILATRGVEGEELESWIGDCSASLRADIRRGAVWVDRSQAFDAARLRIGESLTREEVWDILEPFFGGESAYFAPPKGADDDEEPGANEEEKSKDLVQKAGGWLSSRFGAGKGADFDRIARVYEAMAYWAESGQTLPSGSAALKSLAEALRGFGPLPDDCDGILRLISGPGYKSATRNIIGEWRGRSEAISKEDLTRLLDAASTDCQKCRRNVGGKGRRAWSDKLLEDVERACGFTYLQNGGPARHKEFSVMLDHAARRVSVTHSWIKRAEAERRKFAEDARRIASVPVAAAAWLDNYCKARSLTTGSLDGYRVRRRAAEGWKQLVAKWAHPTCKNAADRIAAARELQDDPEIDKPGDVQLFEAVAADDAACVWQVNGKPDPQPLIDYVAATDAEAKRQRFKVPAYRHPDPLAHPVFCDFGNSRWDIRFAIHERHKSKGKRRTNDAANSHPRGLRLTLWDGTTIDEIAMRWGCKRLVKDLGLEANRKGEVFGVTRADRLGRAVAGVESDAIINVIGLFEQKDWNGRLQAPRRELDAIARRVKHNAGEWDDKARKLRHRLHWLVTFSAKFQPQGPWIDFAGGFPDGVPTKPFVSRRGEFAVKHEDNDRRKGLAKMMLCRLPGLRVLSVDLGHRFAAACAVWETVSREALLREIAGRNIIGGGTGDGHLFLHTQYAGMDGKPRTVVYRRLGADKLPDGSEHPAPWARLDRQFLIKLQGEDRPARKAADDELTRVEQLDADLGRVLAGDRPLAVDELMSSAVNTGRLALRRHGDYARIAWGLASGHKHLPGGSKEYFVPQPGDSPEQIGKRRQRHVAHVQDTLMLWYDLAASGRWKDDRALDLWNTELLPRINQAPFTEPLPLRADDANDQKKVRQREVTTEAWKVVWRSLQNQLIRRLPEEEEQEEKSLRQAKRQAVRSQLAPVAESLIDDPHARGRLRELWAQEWQRRDGRSDNSGKPAKPLTGWYKRLSELRGWILPRRASRHVGGLSLTRIATIRSLWQIHKAFRYRPTPENTRAGIELVEKDAADEHKFGDRMLQAMERMREQRVKQLASRIVEASLGIGSENRRKHWQDGIKRPRRRIDDPRFAPCHAVVIENLTNYRPEETRTRRENRQLMNWSAAKVKKYLSEGCQLHGLHLREVSAGYTSRQDSRTGLPGIRCADVPVGEFRSAPHWKARIRQSADKGDAEAELLRQLDTVGANRAVLRLPAKGGDLFVSSHGRALQADLNAAANIGLRALLDPDWPGRWWYVPCQASTGKPVPDKVAGSAAVALGQSLSPKTQKKSKNEKDVVNLWRCCSPEPLQPGQFKPYSEYWNGAKCAVVRHLRKYNGLAEPVTA